MKQNRKEVQIIELTADELFVWWDWLDSMKDTPEKAFDLFTKFLEECEDQLVYESIDKANAFVECGDMLKDTKEYEIPFTPRHSF